MTEMTNSAPKWIKSWPSKSEINAMFPMALRAMYMRNQRRMLFRHITCNENSLFMSVDNHQPKWIVKGGSWTFKCSCGAPKSRCLHTYAAGIKGTEYLENEGWLQTESPENDQRKTYQRRPPQNNPRNNHSQQSYMDFTGSAKKSVQSHEKKTLMVEADLKTTLGHALIRFYETDFRNKRELLRLRQVYHRAFEASTCLINSSVWNSDDHEFLAWLRAKLPHREIKTLELTALKLQKADFDQWLLLWSTKQPGRFIDRYAQVAITSGSNECLFHVELDNGGEKTQISAIITTPQGKKYPFFNIARKIKTYPHNKPENDFDEFIVDQNLTKITYPIPRKMIWDIFKDKQPSIGTKHVCEHFPALIDNHLEMVKGPSVVCQQKSVKTGIKADIKDGNAHKHVLYR